RIAAGRTFAHLKNYQADGNKEWISIGLMNMSDNLLTFISSYVFTLESNLINEASLSEYDEEIVSCFNDLFNIIHPDDSKLGKDNDDNDIDIAPLPSADKRHPWLIYQIEEYNKGIRHSYKQRLETIWSRPVNRVYVLDFKGFPSDKYKNFSEVERNNSVRGEAGVHEMSDTEMGLDVADTLCFQLGFIRKRRTWRQFILALGLHTEQEMAEAGFGAYWAWQED
ncbi:hypothetical protein Tco_0644843, partial [Tanacetum coccineum]